MLRKTIFLFILILPVLISFSGCGDDNDIVNSTPDKKYFIMGNAILRPYIDMLGSITSLDGDGIDIDSVMFGPKKCIISKSPSFVDGTFYRYNLTLNTQGDPVQYHSGDFATIKIYRGSEVATTSLKLIEIAEDSVVMLDPPNLSNVAVNSEFTISWGNVPNADWYSVKYYYDTSNTPGASIIQTFDFTTDTTFTIPASFNNKDGNFTFYVVSISGPIPGTAGNINSETMTGAFYSSAQPGVVTGWRIISGAGPQKSSAFPPDISTEKRSALTLDDLRELSGL